MHCQKELDKAYFQHDMVYRDLKNLTRRTGSDKILHDKAFNSTKYPKYNGYGRGLVSMLYDFFDKNLPVEQLNMKSYLIKN